MGVFLNNRVDMVNMWRVRVHVIAVMVICSNLGCGNWSNRDKKTDSASRSTIQYVQYICLSSYRVFSIKY